MGRRSKVELAPAKVKALIDAELVRHGFSNYEALQQRLRDAGEDFSKSGLQRYGAKFSERIRRMKTAAEMAKAARDEIGDDDGAMNSYALSLAQGNMVAVLENLPEGVPVAPAFVRALAVLANSRVAVDRALQQYRVKLDAKTAELEVANADKPDALSILEQIRKAYRGLA